MLTIDSLTVQYSSSPPVLQNLCVSMEPAKVHGVVGLNGTGKTTLFNTMYGFKKAQGGSICYAEKPLSRKLLAYLEANNFFYSRITGREYLSLFENKAFTLDGWQQLFALPLDELVEGYSAGMKKKLAILATLKLDKEIVILDEPFNGLDIEAAHILKQLIVRLRERGKTILISSHIFETLSSCCDYIHYLANKRIEHSYSKNEFVSLQGKLEDAIEQKTAAAVSRLL